MISKKVDLQLIESIEVWKDNRNEIVHRSCNHIYDEDAVKEIAIRGNDLTRRLINDSRKVSNHCKR